MEQHDRVASAVAILRDALGTEVSDLERLAGGEFSRAYGFDADGRSYVIRINSAPHAAESFRKDDYAARSFASPQLPIPRVVQVGSAGDAYYAIGERVPGRTIAAHSPEERDAVLQSLLDTLDAIGNADTSTSSGLGDWGPDGIGKFAGWGDYLASVIENHDEGYYAGWYALFDETFLERDLYEAIYARMLDLLAFCPEERRLIHNDYWLENVLADGGHVTGVIDWANALYGDPLYDIARLAWGSAWPGWWYEDGATILRNRYCHLPNYAERITCYACHLGLDDMRYYAKTGRRAEYDFFRPRLLAIVEGGLL